MQIVKNQISCKNYKCPFFPSFVHMSGNLPPKSALLFLYSHVAFYSMERAAPSFLYELEI